MQEGSSTAGAPPGFSRTQATPSPATTPWNVNPAPNSREPRPPPPGFSSSSGQPLVGRGQQQRSVTSSLAKKQKFVPLMSREGQSRAAMHLPGRHVCQCLAQKHDLVNNCVECGRIVCSQVKVQALLIADIIILQWNF